MILFKQADRLSLFLAHCKQEEKTIGFVPTMGALHQGHLSLIQQANKATDITVCSIFINPTQFNNAEDFKKYPITLERDIEMLTANDCDVLFLPSKEEIYPAGYKAKFYDLGLLENMLEGQYRPGHFQGVCQVVDRLLEIVSPTFLYLGQKDFQQCKVIQKLMTLTGRQNISLVIAPTIREADGLAMSSRNLRLTAEQRRKAPALYQTLQRVKEEIRLKPQASATAEAAQSLTEKGFRVDYFEIREAATLLPATNLSNPAVALVAAFLDDIRLIDNLPLN